MKTFLGYYIIGANTMEDAEKEKGLLLWSQTKPSFIKRFLNQYLLGIIWIDKERTDASVKGEKNPDVKLNKVRWSKQPAGQIK
jgi:hypothetical protein